MNQTLYLYTTLGCHLCEQALAIVQPVLAETSVENGVILELVEISEQESWVEQYGIRIPVIRLANQEEELGWPFDADAVVRYLARVSKV